MIQSIASIVLWVTIPLLILSVLFIGLWELIQWRERKKIISVKKRKK